MAINPAPVPRPTSPPLGDVELLERLASARADLLAQVGRRIIGQQNVLDGILTAIFSGGHALLLGVPGLALLVWLVATSLWLTLRRLSSTFAGRTALICGVALVAIAVHSLFYNAFFEDPTTWGLFGLAALAVRARDA